MVKKILGRLVIAGILAVAGAGIASAQGLVAMYCSTIYGRGPVMYYPARVLGASCRVPAGPGTVIFGVFRPR